MGYKVVKLQNAPGFDPTYCNKILAKHYIAKWHFIITIIAIALLIMSIFVWWMFLCLPFLEIIYEIGLKVCYKKATFNLFPDQPKPTIILCIQDHNWDKFYKNWLAGKNPTKSPEWKKGVFACSEFVKED